jgi:hypothetical protein
MRNYTLQKAKAIRDSVQMMKYHTEGKEYTKMDGMNWIEANLLTCKPALRIMYSPVQL